MTQTTTTTPRTSTPQEARRSASRGFMTGTTEARPGIMTTEFWLSIIMAVTVIVAGYVSDAFDVDLAWALGAGIIAAYAFEPRLRQGRLPRGAVHGRHLGQRPVANAAVSAQLVAPINKSQAPAWMAETSTHGCRRDGGSLGRRGSLLRAYGDHWCTQSDARVSPPKGKRGI